MRRTLACLVVPLALVPGCFTAGGALLGASVLVIDLVLVAAVVSNAGAALDAEAGH